MNKLTIKERSMEWKGNLYKGSVYHFLNNDSFSSKIIKKLSGKRVLTLYFDTHYPECIYSKFLSCIRSKHSGLIRIYPLNKQSFSSMKKILFLEFSIGLFFLMVLFSFIWFWIVTYNCKLYEPLGVDLSRPNKQVRDYNLSAIPDLLDNIKINFELGVHKHFYIKGLGLSTDVIETISSLNQLGFRLIEPPLVRGTDSELGPYKIIFKKQL